MAGNTTANTEALIRSEIWADEIEEMLHEQLLMVNYARTLDFPDGNIMTMPSIGMPVVRSRPEGADATYDAIDTGEVSIFLRDEVIAANKVSKKLRQDSKWIAEVSATLPSQQVQVIMERYETDMLALANHQFAGVGNANVINGVNHRFVGNGTNETMAIADFSRVGFVMTKSKMSRQGIVGIVDPSVGFAIENTQNLVNVSNNPRFEGIIETGMSPNMRFVRSVFGVDVYESNLLAPANETIGGKTTTAGVANIFFNISNARLLPFAAAWKQAPETESEINFSNSDLNIQTTARWGNALLRDENLVVVVTDTDQVTF